MLRFDWNALRTGDRVLVHDPRAAEMTLTEGLVDSVDARKGANGVGIRVGNDSSATVLWPSYLAVHRDSRDPREPCWRCQELAGRAERPLRSMVEDAAGAPATHQPDAALILSGTR